MYCKIMIKFMILELHLWQRVSGESDSSLEGSRPEAAESSDSSKRPLKRGYISWLPFCWPVTTCYYFHSRTFMLHNMFVILYQVSLRIMQYTTWCTSLNSFSLKFFLSLIQVFLLSSAFSRFWLWSMGLALTYKNVQAFNRHDK